MIAGQALWLCEFGLTNRSCKECHCFPAGVNESCRNMSPGRSAACSDHRHVCLLQQKTCTERLERSERGVETRPCVPAVCRKYCSRSSECDFPRKVAAVQHARSTGDLHWMFPGPVRTFVSFVLGVSLKSLKISEKGNGLHIYEWPVGQQA